MKIFELNTFIIIIFLVFTLFVDPLWNKLLVPLCPSRIRINKLLMPPLIYFCPPVTLSWHRACEQAPEPRTGPVISLLACSVFETGSWFWCLAFAESHIKKVPNYVTTIPILELLPEVGRLQFQTF